jgi:DNA-binding CsgD family transcriptional regulator
MRDELAPSCLARFHDELRDVGLDGLGRDKQLVGDLSVGATTRHQQVHIHLPAGDAENAIEQAELVGAAVSWNRGCLAYAQAVLAGRAGEPNRATSLAADAAAAFAPFAPWWNNLARRLVAQSALDDGWGDPVAWMHEAAASFTATGHGQLATACRGILRRAGVPVPRSGRGNAQVPAQLQRLGVTSREMDVYLLVARGCSNAEIADQLFISPKTVETHVAKLVVKTGQAGRRELVAHAARNIRT